MGIALEQADLAGLSNEVPVGAVIVKQNRMLSVGRNRPIAASDPTAHAEIVALRAAAKKLANYRLIDTELYVTLEPCVMCAGAIINARVKRVIFGARDNRVGEGGTVFDILNSRSLNHRVAVREKVRESECRRMLTTFFHSKRREGDNGAF
jgi:tRNA(adenine34) deaminase